MNGKKIISTLILAAAIASCLAPIKAQAQEPSSNQEAIIILSTVTLDEMQYARKLIRQKSGRVTTIFPPSVFFGKIPEGIAEELKATGLFEAISYTKLDSAPFIEYETSVLDAIRVWNALQDEKKAPKKITRGERLKPIDEVVKHPELFRSKEERKERSRKYLEHWKKLKADLKHKERIKKEKWREKKNRTVQPGLSYAPGEGETFFDLPGFGAAAGAEFEDTSLYLAGDVAVSLFFMPGTAGNWTASEMQKVYGKIVLALNQLALDEPAANICFQVISELENGYPKPIPGEILEHINDLRNTYNTHWAYYIAVFYGEGRAAATRYGPGHGLFSLDPDFDYAVRHEALHIFGAEDQYTDGTITKPSPIGTHGYLNMVNANSEYNDGNGYFSGAGENNLDIMSARVEYPIGLYTRGQIGWQDEDGDGILDPLDTFPETKIIDRAGSAVLTYTGITLDKPFPCEIADGGNKEYSDITLNTITGVEYRINGGVWLPARAQDGAFDSAQEEFIFTTPELPNGNYRIEARAANSIGNTEASYAEDMVTVTGSSVSEIEYIPPQAMEDTTLKASFIAAPENWHGGAASREIALDASGSFNDNYPQGSLSFSWYFGDGAASINTSGYNIKHTYYNYTGKSNSWQVRLVVKDINSGKTAETTRTIWNVPYNHPPAINNIEVVPGKGLDISGSYKPALGYATKIRVSGGYGFLATGRSLEILDIRDKNSPKLISSYNFPAYNVALSGNYAFLINHYDDIGIEIVNIANPANPVKVRNYALPGAYIKDLFVSGNYLYITDINRALLILKMTNPYAPEPKGTYPGSGNGVYVDGLNAYVASGDGLMILDVSDPLAPKLKASIKGMICMDVIIDGNYAYLAAYNNGLQIVDISNPLQPKQITEKYPQGSPLSGIEVCKEGNFIYLVGISVKDGYRVAELEIIDVRNISFPTLVGSFLGSGNVSGLTVSGNYFYVAESLMGLLSAQITNNARRFGIPSISDQDINTRWDGYLKVRWDMRNDGAWDTKFLDCNRMNVVPLSPGKNRCQLRDRFKAMDEEIIFINIYGDVNQDGRITSYDCALAAQALSGKITLSTDQRNAADVGGDGAVSAYDAALIAQYAVGLIDKFPVEGGGID